MGTIIRRSRKDGSVAFAAQIVIKKNGVIVRREAQTFDRKPTANAWIVKREAELRDARAARLMQHFGRIRDQRPSSIPMQKIVAFALFATGRQEEITLFAMGRSGRTGSWCAT